MCNCYIKNNKVNTKRKQKLFTLHFVWLSELFNVGFVIHLAEKENIWLSVMRVSEPFKEKEKEAKQRRSS